VITSSAATPETVKFALEHGAKDFLAQPVSESKVNAIVRKHLLGFREMPEKKGTITTTMF
jgi:FixJ family two-component response regulator